MAREGACSYVFAAAHPGQGRPAPHRGQVGGEEPLDEHGRDGLILGDARGGQPGDQAGLHDAEAAGDGDGAADEACERVDGDQRRDAGVLPDRVQRRAESQDDQELGQSRAGQHVDDLARLVAIILTLAQMFSRCGRILRLARRRSRGTRAIRAAATPAAGMIQTAAWLPPEPGGAWKEPAALEPVRLVTLDFTEQLKELQEGPANPSYPKRGADRIAARHRGRTTGRCPTRA